MTIMLKPHSVETEFFLQNLVSLCALHRVLIRNQE